MLLLEKNICIVLAWRAGGDSVRVTIEIEAEIPAGATTTLSGHTVP